MKTCVCAGSGWREKRFGTETWRRYCTCPAGLKLSRDTDAAVRRLANVSSEHLTADLAAAGLRIVEIRKVPT